MIKKTKNDRYQVRVYKHGAEITSRTFDRKKDAESWELAQKRAIQMGTVVDVRTKTATLGELITQFNAARKGAIGAKTWDTDEANLRLHVPESLRRREIATITSAELLVHFTALLRKRSRGTVSRIRNSISSLFAWAELNGSVQFNPVAKARLPKGEQTEEDVMRPFTASQLEATLTAIREFSPQSAEVVEFLALTGLRFGELSALRVGHIVELPHPALLVSRSKTGSYMEKGTKSGRARKVPLVSRASEIVIRRSLGKAPNDLVFEGPRDGQLAANNFARDAKLRLTAPGHRLHDLRHTAATNWLRAGIDVKTASKWLGHADSTTTLRRYAHWMGDPADAVAVAMLNDLAAAKPAPIRELRPRVASNR